MMKCEHCGAPFTADETVCSYCGCGIPQKTPVDTTSNNSGKFNITIGGNVTGVVIGPGSVIAQNIVGGNIKK